MLKKVLKGTLAVFFATVFVISCSTDVFAAYPCKGGNVSSTTPGNNSGYNGGGNNGGGSNGGNTPGNNSGYNGGGNVVAPVDAGDCTSILPNSWCVADNGISSVINFVVTILTGAVVVAGTVGIVLCGFMWMSARDNEAQVAKAKKRMLDIVIGVIAWVLLAFLANLFIPKKTSDIEGDISEAIRLQNLAVENVDMTATGYCSQKATGNKPMSPVTASSVDIACADGTTDLGIENEAYTNGTKVAIRLCSIPTIKSTASGDNGNARVNSRVSSAYYLLGKKYYEQKGSYLSVTQSFRTMETQRYFYNCYVNKNCNNGNLAAKPGYSNHQLGTALDFAMNGSGWSNSGVSGFFIQNLTTYGLRRGVSNEPWHVSP